MNGLLVFFANWFTLLFQISGIFCLAIMIMRPKLKKDLITDHKSVFLVFLVLSIIYPIYLTALQYYVWSMDPVSRILLTQPVSDGVPFEGLFNKIGDKLSNSGYFLFYSFGRFWFANFITWFFVALTLVASYLVNRYYFKFNSLREMFYLTSGFLLVGWPKLLVFSVLVLFIALINGFFNKFRNTSHAILIGIPVLIALVITVVFQSLFYNLLGLQILAV